MNRMRKTTHRSLMHKRHNECHNIGFRYIIMNFVYVNTYMFHCGEFIHINTISHNGEWCDSFSFFQIRDDCVLFIGMLHEHLRQSSQCMSILFKDILHVMLAHRDWNHLLGLKWITGNRSTLTRNVESQKANLHFSTLPSVAYLIWDVLSYTFIILAHSNFFHPTNWMLFKMWSLYRCVSLTLFKYTYLIISMHVSKFRFYE